MAIDINQVIENRLRSVARKQAHEQADALGKIIQAEIDRMGLDGHWFLSIDRLTDQVREAYEGKIVQRVNAIVDGLLNPAPQAPTCKYMGADLAASIARLDAHNQT